MVHISIYDDKKTDITSKDFKDMIVNTVKETLLRDWEKVVKLNQREELNNGKKEYYTEISIWE